MFGEYVFLEMPYIESMNLDLIERSRRMFIKKEYDKMIDCLDVVIQNKSLPKAYRMACLNNLAMAYHVRGYYDKAHKIYSLCDDNVFKRINYYAFCHRYFEYKNIQEEFYSGKLEHILQHNKMNYYLNAFGAEEALKYWNDRQADVYDEQVLNSIREHRGEMIEIEQAAVLERKYNELIRKEVDSTPHKNDNETIGIFVTDVQRHKDSAFLFQIVDDLKDEYRIIIYFNNIFQNKLINSFSDKATIRNVANLGYADIINLMQKDRISLLIDFSEYGIRNNSIATANCGIRRILFSELIREIPMRISSGSYYSEFVKENRREEIIVLGDLRYISSDELYQIKKEFGQDKLVFESHALDEPVFCSSFKTKLSNCGFDMGRIMLEKGVLPFKKYMGYISSFSRIIIHNGTSNAEISEIIKCGVPYEVVGIRKVHIDNDAKLIDGIIGRMKDKNDFGITIEKVKRDYILCYREEERCYYVNCTCNGDMLVFDDVVDDRDEYSCFI